MSFGLKSVWPLFIGVALLQLGHGLQGSLVSLEAVNASFSETVTGFIMSGFYIGMLVSSMLAPNIISRVGHIRVFAAFASMVSTAILLVPLWVDAVWWFCMRFIAGLCMAGLAIVVESWLNSASSNADRGKMLSVYMIISYAANGGGQFLLNLGDPSGFVRFIVVSALVSLALVPISLAPVQAPAIDMPKPVSLKDVYVSSPLAFVGTIAAGLGQGTFFAMGAIYGTQHGLSLAQVSIMMALPSVALIVSQFPVGSLSDRFDRRIVMMWLALLTLGISLIILFTSFNTPLWLIGFIGLFGAISFPLYSLALAHANDYLDENQMLGASAKLVLLYGVGAIIGPVISGFLMQKMGSDGFMISLAAIHGGLGFYALYRMFMRPETPDDTPDYIQVAPHVTPVAVQIVAEEYVEASHDVETGAGE